MFRPFDLTIFAQDEGSVDSIAGPLQQKPLSASLARAIYPIERNATDGGDDAAQMSP